MADINLIRISDIAENLTEPTFFGEFIAVDNGLTVPKLELNVLREKILEDAALTGSPTATTPTPGDNSNRVPTTEWVTDELSSLGLGPATDSALGTVRTDVTEAVPIVYLKSSVDTLLASINADIAAVEDAVVLIDGRVSNLEALNIGTTLTNHNARIAALESANLISRMSAVESVNSTQNTNISNLTTTVNGHTTTLSSHNTRLNTLENANDVQSEFVLGTWINQNTVGTGAVLLVGSGGDASPVVSQANGGSVSSNTIITITAPASGTETWDIEFGTFQGITTTGTPSNAGPGRLELIRSINGGAFVVVANLYQLPAGSYVDTLAGPGTSRSIQGITAGNTYQFRLRRNDAATGTFTETYLGVFIHAKRVS